MCGEIDVAIVALGSGGAEICDGRVVALVEMKSGPSAVVRWLGAQDEYGPVICVPA